MKEFKRRCEMLTDGFLEAEALGLSKGIEYWEPIHFYLSFIYMASGIVIGCGLTVLSLLWFGLWL